MNAVIRGLTGIPTTWVEQNVSFCSIGPVDNMACTNGRISYIFVDCNNSGSIPTQLGQLTALVSLRIRGTWLDVMPTEIGNLVELTQLVVDTRSTPVPTQIGSFAKLREFAWSVQPTPKIVKLPTEIGRLRELRSLVVTRGFGGTLPTQIGLLDKLTFLRVAWSQVEGSIPAQIANLTNLVDMTFDNTQICGGIPQRLTSSLNSNNSIVGNFAFNALNSVLCSNDYPVNRFIWSVAMLLF